MRLARPFALGAATLGVLLGGGTAHGDDSRPALAFAWPARGDATVELTDERTVGDESRTIVLSMRLHVEPDHAADRLVIRLADAKLVSIDGRSAGDADPQHTLLAVGRVMKSMTPTLVIGRDGKFLETRDADRMLVNVLKAAGFPALPPGLDAFTRVLNDVAAEDWSAWVAAWIGNGLAPGEWNEVEREMDLDGVSAPLRMKRRGLQPLEPGGHTRLEAQAVYPSESVRHYTAGFLTDLAREAKELDDFHPDLSLKFLQSATYSPMTQTLTVELETDDDASGLRGAAAHLFREQGTAQGRRARAARPPVHVALGWRRPELTFTVSGAGRESSVPHPRAPGGSLDPSGGWLPSCSR